MMTFLKRFNWISFASMVALIVIGAMVLHSAGAARGSAVMAAKWKSMVATSFFGLVLYFGCPGGGSALQDMWDLSSLIRDRTHAPCIISAES